jgi:hypothetical protein
MGKKKNKQHNDEFETNESYEMHNDGRGDYPVQYPDQFDRDHLAVMDDESLHNLGRSLNDSINKVTRHGLNSYPWEVELCYVQQEMQLRSSRRAAHMAWLNNHQAVAEMN